MPLLLEQSKSKLHARIDIISSAFTRHIVNPPKRLVDKHAIQEGLISNLWQAWCYFCRDSIIKSAKGALTSNGVTTASPYAALSDMQIAYIARRASRNENFQPGPSLSGSWQEPTWGDISKISDIITGLSCSNQNSLTSGLVGTVALRDLQTCRNSSAHICASSIISARSCNVRYNQNMMNHPSDMALWIDPVSNDFLWTLWAEDMKLASEIAIG